MILIFQLFAERASPSNNFGPFLTLLAFITPFKKLFYSMNKKKVFFLNPIGLTEFYFCLGQQKNKEIKTFF